MVKESYNVRPPNVKILRPVLVGWTVAAGVSRQMAGALPYPTVRSGGESGEEAERERRGDGEDGAQERRVGGTL